MTDKEPDLRFVCLGTVWLIEPLTECGKQWLEGEVYSEPWQWLGSALGVEWRCVSFLLEAAEEDGLTIKVKEMATRPKDLERLRRE